MSAPNGRNLKTRKGKLTKSSEDNTMASHQLGPEAPRPFSVLSEGHVRRRLELPYIPEDERFSFGNEYDFSMCQLVDKHLEVNTNDRVCYVGDPKGTFAPLVTSHFCLLSPVTSVVPGHIHYEESPGHRMLPFRVANVGAPEFFRQEATVPPQFDKVLLMTCMQFVEEPTVTYQHIMKTMHEYGKLLIIHRAAPMCTLPIFNELRERMMEYDQSYLNIIKDLQSVGLDVQWEIECLPIHMSKMKWMTMIKEKFPSDLEKISNHEVVAGLRELSEGVMKYTGEMVEFTDRLMFITASKPIIDTIPPSVGRAANTQKAPLAKTQSNKPELHYHLKLTADIRAIVQEEARKRYTQAENGRPKDCNIIP